MFLTKNAYFTIKTNRLFWEFKIEKYDNILFREIEPVRAHNFFEDFFGNRWLNFEDDDLRPIFHNR